MLFSSQPHIEDNPLCGCLATPSLPPLKSSISHCSVRAWLLFRPSQGSGAGGGGRRPVPAGLATTLAACLRVGGCTRQVWLAPPVTLHPLLSSLGPGRQTTHCLAPTSPPRSPFLLPSANRFFLPQGGTASTAWLSCSSCHCGSRSPGCQSQRDRAGSGEVLPQALVRVIGLSMFN